MMKAIMISAVVTVALAMPAMANDDVKAATGGAFKALSGEYKDICGAMNRYTAELVDLNGDKQSEVVLIKEGSCEGGNDGAAIELYVKTAKGWAQQLSTTGIKLVALKSRTKGYADVEIGGSGRCFSKYKWNGAAYKYANNCK